jgi:hypothetical protein
MTDRTNHCANCVALDELVREIWQNMAFFRCCALSGEVPKDGAEPFPLSTILAEPCGTCGGVRMVPDERSCKSPGPISKPCPDCAEGEACD